MKKIDMTELTSPVKEEVELETYQELENANEEGKAQKSRPDFRIVQPGINKEGGKEFTNVGAMWRNVSKNGNVFYTLKIGDLKLLVFPNK